MGTDQETVCAALGIGRTADLTEELLAGLSAGLAHTNSPLKDAVENLLAKIRGADRGRKIERLMREILIDQLDLIGKTSSLSPLPNLYYDLGDQFSELGKEYEELLYRMI